MGALGVEPHALPLPVDQVSKRAQKSNRKKILIQVKQQQIRRAIQPLTPYGSPSVKRVPVHPGDPREFLNRERISAADFAAKDFFHRGEAKKVTQPGARTFRALAQPSKNAWLLTEELISQLDLDRAT